MTIKSMPTNQEYREGWDRLFKKPKEKGCDHEHLLVCRVGESEEIYYKCADCGMSIFRDGANK